jgi:hypothetical protein
VSPARQEERHACLRLTPIQEDQPRHIQRDQSDGSRAAYSGDAQTTQRKRDSDGEGTGGTIQSGRHGRTSTGYAWFGQTSS